MGDIMVAEKSSGFGWRVFGFGIIALGLYCLIVGNFDPGQPVPKAFPDRTILAYIAAVFLIVAGVAVEWPRFTKWGAGAIAVYYTLVVTLLMNGHIILKYPAEYGAYSGTAEQLALAMGGLIVFASSAELDDATAARLIRTAQIVFGICAILFGGAHFFYMNLTAPLVPAWLPPNQVFWGYATGVFHIAAGIAIITGIQARLAAILLTVMYASFSFLVHLPLLIGAPHNLFYWSENALNLALTGVAWVVADSLKSETTAPHTS
jgi:uncharacterized membrane protein YphA (DoxX/SURF4 family)